MWFIAALFMWYAARCGRPNQPEIDEMFTMHPRRASDFLPRAAALARRRRHELAHAVARERKRRVLVGGELLGRRVAHVDARRRMFVPTLFTSRSQRPKRSRVASISARRPRRSRRQRWP